MSDESRDTNSAPASPDAEAVMAVTEQAGDILLGLRAEEDDPDALALRIEVTGASGDTYDYEVYFEALSEAGDDDVVFHSGGLPVMVAASDVDRLRNATLEADAEGLRLLNPNRPPLPESPPPLIEVPMADMASELAERVGQFLDAQINPQIAGHGGRANLVGFEAGVAYLVLSGGCQGCGMAAVTLERGIKEAIFTVFEGEVVDVVDVTNHAAGTDPYYQASKK